MLNIMSSYPFVYPYSHVSRVYLGLMRSSIWEIFNYLQWSYNFSSKHLVIETKLSKLLANNTLWIRSALPHVELLNNDQLLLSLYIDFYAYQQLLVKCNKYLTYKM